MKRYIVLFLTFTVAGLLCACSQKDTANLTVSSYTSASGDSAAISYQSEPAQVQKKEGQEQKIAIEISPPEGWKPMEGSVLPVHYMKSTASFMVKEERFQSTELDAIVTEALGIYQKSFDNVAVVGDVETITVDGKEAKKLIFTCTVGKLEMKYLYVYLLVEGRTYVITFGDLANTFDTLSADYEAILSNIGFKAQ